MKRFGSALVLVACFLSSLAMPVTEMQVQQVMQRLDAELEARDVYINEHQSRIDSLRLLLVQETESSSARLGLLMTLADEYVAFNADSAVFFFDEGHKMSMNLGLDSLAMIFRLQRDTYLPLLGFIDEAIDDYDDISVVMVDGGSEMAYYDAGRQMYSYISSFYEKYPGESARWAEKSRLLQLQLLQCLDKKSLKYRLNLGESYYSAGENNKARAVLLELLAEISENTNIYARASHMLSSIAHERGEEAEYVYYLTLSAIADIKSATLEVMSLQELGEYMFKNGDVERAHKYLSVALDYAVRCNAVMRMVQSSQAMPIIASAHEVERQLWQRKVYAFVVVLVVMLLGLLVLLMFLRREMRRMSVLQDNLRNANRTKEVYIAQFLSLCSIYMDKLNQFSKIVNRKIAAGKVDDLFRMTKSGKFVEEQSREFYEVFDNAFLHIYPTFVRDVNALLKHDEQIVLPEGERLNTDLRILAFMRLGIEESTRIAQVLNYSVNTIYTYRNKLKNKAINRDDFEANIMKIESIS